MAYEVSKEVLEDVIKYFADTAKKLRGDLVIFTSRLEDEYVIRNLNDFHKLKIRKGEVIDATVYVGDDDELYEEFKMGSGKDDAVIKEKFLNKK